MKQSILEGDNKATDVASYIINYCHSCDISITNLKLQKLLYFCEASYLIHTKGKNSCFEQHIVAWPYGPVVQGIYFKYSNYKSNEITDSTVIDTKLINENVIKTTLEVFAPYDAYVLADITHAEKPWNDAYKNGNNTVIEKYEIYKYLTTSRSKYKKIADFKKPAI